MQVTVRSQAILAPRPWIHYLIWVFSLTNCCRASYGWGWPAKCEGCLHPREQSRKPPSLCWQTLEMFNSYFLLRLAQNFSIHWHIGTEVPWFGKAGNYFLPEGKKFMLCCALCFLQSSSDSSQAFSAVCQSPALFMGYIRSPSTSLRWFQLLSAAMYIAIHSVKPKLGVVKDSQEDVHCLSILSTCEGMSDPRKDLCPTSSSAFLFTFSHHPEPVLFVYFCDWTLGHHKVMQNSIFFLHALSPNISITYFNFCRFSLFSPVLVFWRPIDKTFCIILWDIVYVPSSTHFFYSLWAPYGDWTWYYR